MLHIEELADTGLIEEVPDPTEVNGGKKQSMFVLCLFVCLFVRMIEGAILYVCDTASIYSLDFFFGTESRILEKTVQYVMNTT